MTTGELLWTPAAPGKWNTAEIASDPRVNFLLALGRALHAAGHSAQGLEDLLEEAAARLGLEGEFFTTPTSIFAAFGQDARQRTFLIRVNPGPPNLGRLSAIKSILDRVLSGLMPPAEGAVAMREASVRRSPYTSTVSTLGFALSSAASSVFLGGGAREMALAAVLGLVTGLLALGARRLPPLQRVFPAAASFLVAALATAAGALLGGVSVSIATLAGLIVLLPGLMLVTAMSELATGHLTSGTARAAGAFITFIGIGFGVALGTRVATALLGPVAAVSAHGLPGWATWPALAAAAVAFSILLQADRRDLPWIIAAAMLAILASDLGTRLVGAELGPFFGSFAMAIAGWMFSRLTDRPANVVVAPGVLVLVPGSIGFRSVTALLDARTVAGVETAFNALLTAIALVVGLLIANVILPTRRDI